MSTRLSAPESLFAGEANAGAQRPHELDVAFLVRIDEAVPHHEVDEHLHGTEPGGRDAGTALRERVTANPGWRPQKSVYMRGTSTQRQAWRDYGVARLLAPHHSRGQMAVTRRLHGDAPLPHWV